MLNVNKGFRMLLRNPLDLEATTSIRTPVIAYGEQLQPQPQKQLQEHRKY